MRRWSDLLCAFPNAATAGAENATINAKATKKFAHDTLLLWRELSRLDHQRRLDGSALYSDHGLGCAITFTCNAAWEQQRLAHKIPLSTPARPIRDAQAVVDPVGAQ